MLTNPSRFRRTAAGTALVLAPLLFLIGDIISPAWSDDTAEFVQEVADSPDATGLSSLLFVIGFALFVPGVIGIVHLIRGRGVTLAHIAGTLAVIGLGAFPALAATGVIDTVVAETLNQADHAALIDGFEDQWTAIVLLLVILVPATLSLILIAAAVWRAGLAPPAVAIVLIASAVVIMAGGTQVLAIIADVLMLVGFGYLGLRMLQMSDEVWDRPPHDWRESSRAPDPVG